MLPLLQVFNRKLKSGECMLKVKGTVEEVRQGHDVMGFFVLFTVGVHLGRFPSQSPVIDHC